MAANVAQPVIVENRPGAGGTIGTGQVAKSPPDGSTPVVVSSEHVANPVLYGDKIPYELKDLAGVIPLGSPPMPLSPAGFDATILREANELGPIMKAAGIKGG